MKIRRTELSHRGDDLGIAQRPKAVNVKGDAEGVQQTREAPETQSGGMVARSVPPHGAIFTRHRLHKVAEDHGAENGETKQETGMEVGPDEEQWYEHQESRARSWLEQAQEDH